MRTHAIARAALLAAGLGAAGPLAAQQPDVRAGVGAGFETYRFADATAVNIESITLFATPVAARFGLTRALSLQLSGAWARGELRRGDGSTAVIDGPTDTELGLTAAFGRDAVTVTAIALLPTGTASLSDDEADVAGMIAADVLPFRISSWGTGGGIGLSTALAQPLGGGFAAGIGAGYVVAREFEPLAGDFTYRPGNQLQVRAVLDRTFGTAGKAAIQLSYQRFSVDRGDGANLFQSGDRLQAVGSYAFAAGERGSGIVYAGWLHRAEGAYRTEARVVPPQDLVYTGGGLRLPAGGAVFQPTVEFRLLSGTDVATDGYTAGGGLAVEVPAGALTLVPSARGRFGSVRLQGASESGFAGADIGLAVRFGAALR
jgi:hypothetical protein